MREKKRVLEVSIQPRFISREFQRDPSRLRARAPKHNPQARPVAQLERSARQATLLLVMVLTSIKGIGAIGPAVGIYFARGFNMQSWESENERPQDEHDQHDIERIPPTKTDRFVGKLLQARRARAWGVAPHAHDVHVH